MLRDPIVEEVRKQRQQWAASFSSGSSLLTEKPVDTGLELFWRRAYPR